VSPLPAAPVVSSHKDHTPKRAPYVSHAAPRTKQSPRTMNEPTVRRLNEVQKAPLYIGDSEPGDGVVKKRSRSEIEQDARKKGATGG
jgi:hypothetical protein